MLERRVVVATLGFLALAIPSSSLGVRIIGSGSYVDEATAMKGSWKAILVVDEASAGQAKTLGGGVTLSDGPESGTMLLEGRLTKTGIEFDFTTLGGESALFDGTFEGAAVSGVYHLGNRTGTWLGKFNLEID